MSAGYAPSRPVLHDVTLEVPAAGLTHVVGANGSGKSTLVELVSGYLRPTAGSVTVAGLPASSPAARDRRRVCRTRPALFGRMSVRDHLVFASRCARTDPRAAFARATSYGLDDWLDTDAGALSTGNARKVWLLTCTLGDFSVAVLDEPFAGLDEVGTRVLVGEITQWSDGGAVALVSHGLPPELRPRTVLELPARSAPGAQVDGRRDLAVTGAGHGG